MPGVKRKPKTFSYNEIKNIILSIGNAEDKFALALAYANGCRISEVLGARRSDIEVKPEFVYFTTPVLKKRRVIIPKRAPPISRTGEAWLADTIINFVAGKKGKLLHFSKRTLHRRFDKYAHCTPHSFRHTRATHCFRVLGMTMEKVGLYFRISPTGMASWIETYGHLDRTDLEEHLRGRFRVKKGEGVKE